MKTPTSSPFRFLAFTSIFLTTPVFAAVNIDFVRVGDPGNASNSTGYGGVAYSYQVAKNETTIFQYTEFLNKVAKTDPYMLYNSSMASNGNVAGITRSGLSGNYIYAVLAESGNRPITHVNWFDAARFCNWLHNDQGNGGTETGAYTLGGAMSGIILRNSDAKVSLPNENELYKAAYYDPTPGAGGGDNYWQFSMRRDTLINNSVSANYFDGDFAVTQGIGSTLNPTQNYLTDVGAYGVESESFYGTNDQGGNVYEWNDSVFGLTSRGISGGSWNTQEGNLAAYTVAAAVFYGDHRNNLGFRVAIVPEPTSLLLTVFAGVVMLGRRKR